MKGQPKKKNFCFRDQINLTNPTQHMYANKVDIIIFDENSNHRGPPYCFYVSRILIAFNLIGIRHEHKDRKKKVVNLTKTFQLITIPSCLK